MGAGTSGVFKKNWPRDVCIRPGKLLFTPPHKKTKNYFFPDKKQFPLITFCCWHTSALKEFFQHFAVYDFLLIETERETIDAVFHFIKETNKNTFKEPSRDMMENFVFDGKDAVIVKSLISEAPLQDVDAVTVPTIEKILVDLVADSETFFFCRAMKYSMFLKARWGNIP